MPYLPSMIIGYQGEPHSYSHQASTELFPDGQLVGFRGFASAFAALEAAEVDRLVVPVENSTTGSVLPVLDRLPGDDSHVRFSILAEHLVEVRHALHGLKGASLDQITEVRSHPEALAQAERALLTLGVEPVPTHDTAGAVRTRVAEGGDPTIAALAPPKAGAAHGLVLLKEDVLDKAHNTTRFVVIHVGDPEVNEDDDKTTIVVTFAHTRDRSLSC